MKTNNNQKSIDLGMNWRRRRKTAQPLTSDALSDIMRLYRLSTWQERRELIDKLYIHGAVAELRAIAKSDGHPLCKAEAASKLADLAANGVPEPLDKQPDNV